MLTLSPLAVAGIFGILYLCEVVIANLRKKKLQGRANSYITSSNERKGDASGSVIYSSKAICNAFAYLDQDGKGVVDSKNLALALRSCGVDSPDAVIEELLLELGRSKFMYVEFAQAAQEQEGTAVGFIVDRIDAKLSQRVGGKLSYCFLLFTFLILVGVSSVLFEYFQCKDFDLPEGGVESYVRRDYSVDCQDSRYLNFKLYAGFMICIYPLGIPLLYG